MKVLIYSHYFAPSVGGVETIVRSLASGISEFRNLNGEREFHVTVVTETAAGSFDDETLPFRTVRQPSFLELWHLIRTSDVLHAAGPALAPLILGLFGRKPVVVEHHGFQVVCPNGQLLMERTGTPCPGHFMAGRHIECVRCNSRNGWFSSSRLWLFTLVRRSLCALVSANIVPTQWLGGVLHLPRITAIPHGLELTAAAPCRLRPQGPPVIVFQGRLVSTKGVGLLFNAARILRDEGLSFELHIIGDGPERNALGQFARELGLTACVNFVGTLPPEELDAALAKAMVVAVPSLAGEVFGLVIAENMQRAHAIVASDIGPFVEVLGDAGLTFRTGDAFDLASNLARLLQDPSLVDNLGQIARKRVHDYFHRSHMIEEHVRLYRTVC